MLKAIRVIEHLWIPLDGGRRLAARLWLPALDAPAPAIFEYLPYRKRDGTAPRDATTFPVFAEAGYAGIRVDIAGTGESDGLFDDEYSERELLDGEAVIAWIAHQPWCDGNVGMIGISWGGFSGLQLAFRRPPALKAIVTACSTTDRYRDDTHFMDGCLLTDNFGWSGQMTAFLTRPPDPLLRDDWRAEWLERIDKLPFLASVWQRHPKRDDYWRHASISEDWSAIRAATLAVGGWSDAYLNAPPALAAHLDAPVKALIGPWEHKYPHIAEINPADFHGEVLGWFDRWLKGVQNGAEDLPAYRAFMQEHEAPSADYGPQKGRWIAEKAWPSPFVFEQVLNLTDNGLSETPGGGECVVATPLQVGQASAYWCPGMRIGKELAGDQAGDDGLSACFDTAPLDAPLELLGRARVAIAFTVDRPVAQLCLRLCDVAPDGTSQRISFRAFNLAHHAGHDAPAPLQPGQVYRAEIQLNECAHQLRAGHRLRLAVSTSYWPLVWPAPEAAAVTLQLADCQLILPERRAEKDIDPAPPGPPQDFPRYGDDVLRKPVNRLDERVEDNGTLVRESFDDFGMIRDPDHGMAFGSQVTQIYAIQPDDPLSARHEVTWRFEFRRGDWSVRIDSENVMTSDAETFRLERKVTAIEGDAVALERRWQEDIPRGLL
ncbi:MAG: CocE/NonD family hydrolase [Geminicoccaceae bacterium]